MIITPAVNFNIENRNDIHPSIQSVLKDLPYLTKLVAQDTGQPITGTIDIKFFNPVDDMRHINTLLNDKSYFFSKSNTKDSNKEDKSFHFAAACAEGKSQGKNDTVYIHNTNINSNQLKSTLYHELIHISQYQNAPELFRIHDILMHSLQKAVNIFGPQSKKSLILQNAVLKYKQVIEGQAYALQLINEEKHFNIKPHEDISTSKKRSDFLVTYNETEYLSKITPIKLESLRKKVIYIDGAKLYNEKTQDQNAHIKILKPQLTDIEINTAFEVLRRNNRAQPHKYLYQIATTARNPLAAITNCINKVKGNENQFC